MLSSELENMASEVRTVASERDQFKSMVEHARHEND